MQVQVRMALPVLQEIEVVMEVTELRVILMTKKMLEQAAAAVVAVVQQLVLMAGMHREILQVQIIVHLLVVQEVLVEQPEVMVAMELVT